MSKTEEKSNNWFTNEVIDYVLNKIPPYVGLFVIRTDQDGMIKSYTGPWDKYLSKKPLEGTHIEESAPFLYGIIPPLVNPMVISHLRLTEKHYADVHVLADKNSDNWIFFIDQTREVEIIQPIVQFLNKERLEQRTIGQRSAYQTLSALYLLDYLAFERKGDNYRQLGKAPQWFSTLKLKYSQQSTSFPLKELFPYLEVFEFEAETIWNKEEDDKLLSDIWQEISHEGETVYLQALALRHERRNYLLIKPLDKSKDLSDNFLQKAREQKLTLDQLASTERKLKELLGFKDQFVSIISHDLRSPIGAIIGLIELLTSDEHVQHNLKPEQLELLNDIKNEMFRLLDYNDKLFQWSNLELGNFKIRPKTFAVKNLANYAEKMQRSKLQQKGIIFQSEIEENLMIHADETLMGQAINNLVGNSVKFTSSGGRITFKAKVVDQQIHISVSDTGVGMDEQTAARLFEGFTRKSTVGTHGEKGTGLGMGIVKKIVEAHAFSINVYSTPGKGTTFNIYAPLSIGHKEQR